MNWYWIRITEFGGIITVYAMIKNKDDEVDKIASIAVAFAKTKQYQNHPQQRRRSGPQTAVTKKQR